MTDTMTGSITHFEIYGEQPIELAEFYRSIFGWQIEQMPGVDYWRIQIPPEASSAPRGGGLTYRAIPGLNGWMFFVNVESMDDALNLVQALGGSIIRPKTAVPKTAWVTLVADPGGNMFGIWQADPTAFPPPEPH
jgi:uncharacterized protein